MTIGIRMPEKTSYPAGIRNLLIRMFLVPIEKWLLKSPSLDAGGFSPPVFVIGPPRSGTTLLYQILVHRFNFIYFTNFSSKFFMAPLIGTWLAHLRGAFTARKSNGYTSDYGRTGSPDGPSESGEFWYRWFPRGQQIYVPPKATNPKSIEELRRQVAGISKKFNAPMIFKNTYNSMRIAPIMEAFPEAVFIVCQRDPLDIAQSILTGRITRNGNKQDWWSVPPKEIEEIKEHPYWEHIPEQVYYIYKQIESDSHFYGPQHFLNVSYKELCETPGATLESIRIFLKARGVELTIKNEAPERFKYSTGIKSDDENYDLLQKKVNELWRA
jgi:hypothetical protein